MTAHPPLGPDDFPEFFKAVHGHEPFPWQHRLVRSVAEGGWPAVLDLPTGSGKTAVLDVAMFALALDAGRRPRTAPLRMIYVVDRRTIVDQAYERALVIRRALDAARHHVVQRVRERLSGYTAGGSPLNTALLRGGIARDDSWARTPDQPVIVVSTVDQVGSRLLFRGYGVSDSMKPVHAGLLGCDVLYLLDEVHLSQPFQETLHAVGSRYRTWATRSLPLPFGVVEMSATPHRGSTVRFSLDDDDRRHPVLAARLSAGKPAALVSVPGKTFARDVETHALALLHGPGATVAVVVNRVDTAREIHERLSSSVKAGTAVHLLTGRMRPFDRDTVERGVLPRIRAGRVRRDDEAPVVVVATQSIEAGADFDFDGLVTECASLDALRQRFGRLDRLGALAGAARGVIVVRIDARTDDPVYGDAIGQTENWLESVAKNGVVDFGLNALVVPPDADALGLLAPSVHAPVLLPSHLDAWVQTAPVPAADPDVALWLHGPQRGIADVQIVWRADLDEHLLRVAASADEEAERATTVALSLVEALPPVSGEAMSVPFVAAKRWLENKSAPDVFDVEGAMNVDEDDDRAEPERAPRAAVVWMGDESVVVLPKSIRPGQTLIVPAGYGGIADGNWAPASIEPVQDVAEIVAWRQGRRPTLRLHPSVWTQWSGTDPARPRATDTENVDDRADVGAWLESVATGGLPDEISHLLQWLCTDTRLEVARNAMPRSEDGEFFIVTGRRRPIGARIDSPTVVTESVESSFTGVQVTLARHSAGVCAHAVAFAERVGLPGDLVRDLRLAAVWHDAGKADSRFQRWLHGGSEFKALTQAEPLAKSTVRDTSRAARRRSRERAGYPAGGRHECTSIALMTAAQESLSSTAGDWSLVRHVVASHHGHARPLVPWSPDPQPVDVAYTHDGAEAKASSAHGFERLDSGVAERFWHAVRTYGWWGLAFIECTLRLADHVQSSAEQEAKSGRDA